MYDRILLPTDGSVIAEEAVDHALAHAPDDDTEIHVLHVMQRGNVNPNVGYDRAIEEAIRERGQEALDSITDEIEASEYNPTIERALEGGSPAHEIVDYAEEHDIDLIVMGTHGRSGVTRVLLGSVAERVVRHAPVPVLTVTPDDLDTAV